MAVLKKSSLNWNEKLFPGGKEWAQGHTGPNLFTECQHHPGV